MIRTVNRQPMSVPVKGNKDKFFNQVEFKGLCDKQNDVTVDAQTFSDVENMFVDDDNILTSRPPLKFYDGEAHIVDQWFFGSYGLRLYRIQTQMKYVDTDEVIKNELDTPIEYFSFILRCISHETVQGPEKFDILQWFIPVNEVGYNFLPKVNLTQLEDKIYIWFAGADFVCFNTSGLYFEDAVKYLYLPVHKQVTNGIESELETKNFLTDTYRKRHLYNAFSDINFEKLVGREMTVSLNSNETKNKSKHLYDITVQKNQDKMLIYPSSNMGNNYHIDIVQTPRATVTMRYSSSTNIIEVSFDGKFFRPLPILENIMGNPQLTRDGMWVVAFTRNGLAKCRLVAQETADFVDIERVLAWTLDLYFLDAVDEQGGSNAVTGILDITPTGYFETIDQYAYIVWSYVGQIDDSVYPCLYSSWLSKTKEIWSLEVLKSFAPVSLDGNGYMNGSYHNNFKMKFTHVSPTAGYANAQALVSIISDNFRETTDLAYYDNVLFNMFFVEPTGASTKAIHLYNPLHERYMFIELEPKNKTLIIDNKVYTTDGIYLPSNRFDISITTSLQDKDNLLSTSYSIKTIYSLCAVRNEEFRLIDTILETKYTTEFVKSHVTYSGVYRPGPTTIRPVGYSSQYFKILGSTTLTDNYLLENDNKTMRITNTELSPFVTDTERLLANDTLILESQSGAEKFIYEGNVFKGFIFKGYIEPPYDVHEGTGPIQDSDRIIYLPYIETRDEVLNYYYMSTPDEGRYPYYRFRVHNYTRLGDDYVRNGDLICLMHESKKYPSAPDGWNGLEWPTTGNWKHLKPVYILDGEIHFWKPGDVLPTGAIQFVGYANIKKKVKPLIISETGITYLIDGMLWTSELSSSSMLELDEFINAKYEVDNSLLVNVSNEVPDHTAQLNETYMSFKTIKNNKNLLQVTSTRRDENKLFTEEGHDLLLYLPKINEQQFSKKITNLHTLSENEMGIFTEDEIWYIKAIVNDTMVDYTAPIKSKLPVGCRDGSEIITALDGKVIIFTTQRGVTALSPQDFIASTEQTINYLSDNIQTNYQKFYNDEVFSSMLMPDEFVKSYSPLIKIRTYRYWVLFYRYMDRTILMLDTRNGSWWKWSTPYPIRSITVGTKLHILMQLDYSLIKDKALYSPVPPKKTLLGVSYILSDSEEIEYYDDTVENVLNGQGELIHENDEVGDRRVVQYADPMIRWHFVSQRLHFNEINSYKTVKAINMSAKGTNIQTAKLSNKVYRDFYHPEQSRVSEIKINDIRTFVQSLNLMHVVNFQYKIETDELNEEQSQIRINSLSIKYGVKENIR